jgi:hypothetical protein
LPTATTEIAISLPGQPRLGFGHGLNQNAGSAIQVVEPATRDRINLIRQHDVAGVTG